MPTGASGQIAPPPLGQSSNPIVVENSNPGDSNWNWAKSSHNHEIEGYADHASAKAGQTVQVMVSSDMPHSASWTLFRIGWYGGTGMREMFSGPNFSVTTQAACPMATGTGLIRCQWTPSFSFTVSPDWASGLYLIDLVRDDQFASWIPLVITDDRPSDLLFQSSVTTAQAYNPWGGTSLYIDQTGTLPWGKAVEVSFDRPYGEGNGTGQVLRYEAYMAHFLEEYGYDVSYTTNLDVAYGGGDLLRKHRAFLSVGHDEYWPKAERDALEAARDQGVNELFFSANSGYWQVRLDGDSGGGNSRLMTGWKEAWRHDPVQGPEVTAQFRDPVLGRPENGLIGVMYDAWSFLRFPMIVNDPTHFVFRGTQLGAGDSLPWIVGYESDRIWDNGSTPSGLEVAARSPVASVFGLPTRSEATSYRAPSGALVFSGGTIEWSLALADGPVHDTRVERMTANVLHEALGLPIPEGLEHLHPPSPQITGPFAGSVSTVATNLGAISAIAALPDGSLALADPTSHRILRLGPPPARDLTVLAGDGQAGADGWAAPTPGAQCRFNQPGGLVADAAGNLFVADTGNGCVRKILPDAHATVVTVAGQCGEPGFVDGALGVARFNTPMGLALMPVTGDLVVADSWNHRVRLVSAMTGATSTLVGSVEGTSEGPAATALVDYPTAVAVDASGRVYVASSGSYTIARIDIDPARTVTLLTSGTEGASDGTGDVAGIGPQQGLVWDGTGLLVSDASNGRIRRLIPGTQASDTHVTTLAGDGRRGLVDGTGDQAQLGLPLGLAIGPNGMLFVADAANQAVRAIQQ